MFKNIEILRNNQYFTDGVLSLLWKLLDICVKIMLINKFLQIYQKTSLMFFRINYWRISITLILFAASLLQNSHNEDTMSQLCYNVKMFSTTLNPSNRLSPPCDHWRPLHGNGRLHPLCFDVPSIYNNKKILRECVRWVFLWLTVI